jgi:hypothetical protein
MFTSQPIGFVSSPYKDTSEIPKGLGAKHAADGVLQILPEFAAGLTDIEGFSHPSSSGSSIARKASNCLVNRPRTIGRMVCLRRDLRDAPTRLA